MSVYITNITTNVDIGIESITLKPGRGGTFPDRIAELPGFIAYVKKGWLKSEMVKEVPDAVSVGEVKKVPDAVSVSEVKKAPKKEVKNSEPVSAVPKTEAKGSESVTVTSKTEPSVVTPSK